MRISFAGVLGDAWSLFRRDADLLLRIAAPFFFLPVFALTLFVPPMPMPDAAIADRQVQAQRWAEAAMTWLGGYAPGFVAAYVVVFFGLALVTTLYCDPTRPDLRGAFARTATLFPRFILATVLVSLPAGLGLWFLYVPGLYVIGRTMLTAPTLIADRSTGAVQAIRASLRTTRGAGLTLMGLAAFVYLLGALGGQPLLLLDAWMRGNGAANPVAVAIVDAGAAAVAMATQLALAMIAIAAYRRLAR